MLFPTLRRRERSEPGNPGNQLVGAKALLPRRVPRKGPHQSQGMKRCHRILSRDTIWVRFQLKLGHSRASTKGLMDTQSKRRTVRPFDCICHVFLVPERIKSLMPLLSGWCCWSVFNPKSFQLSKPSHGAHIALCCALRHHPEAVEVLLRARAFVIKRVASEDGASAGSCTSYRQFSWSKHGGPTNSWNLAKVASGWPDEADWLDPVKLETFLAMFGNTSWHLEVMLPWSYETWDSAAWNIRGHMHFQFQFVKRCHVCSFHGVVSKEIPTLIPCCYLGYRGPVPDLNVWSGAFEPSDGRSSTR